MAADGSMAKIKEEGKLRQEGRDYVMADGDICVAATAHLDGPQWTGIFTHTAGDTPRPIYGGQFL